MVYLLRHDVLILSVHFLYQVRFQLIFVSVVMLVRLIYSERKIHQMDMETMIKIQERRKARKEFQKTNKSKNNVPTGVL